MNCVEITGMLREKINDYFRYLEYELPYLEENTNLVTKIAVKFWTNQKENRLMSLPKNTRVAVHGHLDAHEKFGTILHIEQLEVISK